MPLFLPDDLALLSTPSGDDFDASAVRDGRDAGNAVDAVTGWSASDGACVVFGGAEAHHASSVRRLSTGERISVADGCGLELRGEIVASKRDHVVMRVLERLRQPDPSPTVTLVQALAKGGRDELAVQSATEAGVDAVIPWQAKRSISVWHGRKAETGRARWSSVVHEAAKQSLRPRVPLVHELVSTADLTALIDQSDEQRLALLLDPEAEQRLSTVALDSAGTLSGHGLPTDILIIIGPEGGTDPAERSRLLGAGAVPVRLGESVLRTSSAGLAAISVLSARLNRW